MIYSNRHNNTIYIVGSKHPICVVLNTVMVFILYTYALYTVTTTTPSKPHPQANPRAMPEVAAAIVHSIPPVRRHVYLSEQKAKKKRYRQSLNLERLTVPPSMIQRSSSVEATVDMELQEGDTRPPSEREAV